MRNINQKTNKIAKNLTKKTNKTLLSDILELIFKDFDNCECKGDEYEKQYIDLRSKVIKITIAMNIKLNFKRNYNCNCPSILKRIEHYTIPPKLSCGKCCNYCNFGGSFNPCCYLHEI